VFRYNTGPDYEADARRLRDASEQGYKQGFERGLYVQYSPRSDMLGRTWLNPDPIQRVVRLSAPTNAPPRFGEVRQYAGVAYDFEAFKIYIDGPCPIAYWAWRPLQSILKTFERSRYECNRNEGRRC